jgi:anti-sigma factor RsiW
MTASCPPEETLVQWLDGELAGPALEDVARHVSGCDRCADRLERTSAVDVLLAEELARPTRAATRPLAWLPLAAAAVLLLGLLAFLLRLPGAPSMSAEEIAAQTRPPLPAAAPRIAAFSGGAELRSASADLPHSVALNELLHDGDRIATGAGQRAKLSLASDAFLVLNENSSLRIAALGEGGVDVRLEQGELLATAGRSLQISTPEGPVAVEGGDIVVRAGRDQTTVSVLRGRGRMKGRTLDGGDEGSVRAKSLLKIRKLDRSVDVRWASAVRGVFYEDDFSSPGSSSHWRLSEGATASTVSGRPALLLSAHPGERRGYAYARFGRDLPVDQPLVFDVDFRVPRNDRAGRAQVVIPLTGPDGPSNLRWSLSRDEEALEAHGDLTGRKHSVLWKGRSSAADGEWHHLHLVVSATDVLVERDGVLLTRVPHGLPAVQKASLVLGSLAKQKGEESFECGFSGVRILRETFE